MNVQFSIEIRVPKGRAIARSLAREAIRHWARTGKMPRGMKIRAIIWRNPDATAKGLGPGWRTFTGADIEAASKLASETVIESPHSSGLEDVRNTLREVLL